MTEDEFEVWIDRHQTLFPKLREWLGDQPDAVAILSAWSSALRLCDPAHAKEATDRLLRGVDPVVKFNDWSELPAVVIQHCRLMGSGKAERTGDGNYVPGSALKALRRILLTTVPESVEKQAIEDFRLLIEVMRPEDLRDTKRRIIKGMDDGLSAPAAYELMRLADEKAGVSPGGNVGPLLS